MEKHDDPYIQFSCTAFYYSSGDGLGVTELLYKSRANT